MDGDGRLIHTLASHPPQQLYVSLQVAPKKLWEVLGMDTHFDKLGQPLHGTLGNHKVQRSIEVAFTPVPTQWQKAGVTKAGQNFPPYSF